MSLIAAPRLADASENDRSLACVDVIVRSTGDPLRRAALRRAVASVTSQSGVRPTCVVVFNGAACDAGMIEWARRQPRVIVKRIEGGKREATLAGRRSVQSPFFCFLDDDDEILPGALAEKAAAFQENPLLACVASNAYWRRFDREELLLKDTRLARRGDFARSILTGRNWLVPGASMFSTAVIGETFFDNLPAHREWTVIGFRIASSGLPVRFIDAPACRIHNTAKSQTKTRTYAESELQAWIEIERCNRRRELLPAIRGQQARSLRRLSSYYRCKGEFSAAWDCYWEALRRGAGFHFIPYALLLVAKSTKPFPEIAASLPFVRKASVLFAFVGRVLRRPTKYFTRKFWRSTTYWSAFRTRAALLYTVPTLFRKRGKFAGSVVIFPNGMNWSQAAESYVAWKVLTACGLRLRREPKSDTVVALTWHAGTQVDAPEAPRNLPPGTRVLNLRCHDIRKSRVGDVFEEVFGYRLEVDPFTYRGPMIRKSEMNGLHDAIILDKAPDRAEPGFVYQRLVTHAAPDGIYEWRLFIVGARPVETYAVIAPYDDRFTIWKPARVVALNDTFTPEEQEKIAEFCARIGLDFGALDVLRDSTDGRLYICDCNNTPTGPTKTLPTREQVRLVRRLAAHFESAYLGKHVRPSM